MNLSETIWKSMNPSLKGGVFGAFIILSFLCTLFLLSRTILWIFLGISLVVTLYTGYLIFIKK